MPPLRFYTDSHIPKQVAIQLRTKGIDVVRCQEIGYADASDRQHLEKATSQLRMVITGDADFPVYTHSGYRQRNSTVASYISSLKAKEISD